MKRNAVYGVGTGINGREAAMQATQRALDQAGSTKAALALVFVSQEYNVTEVLTGLTGLLGDTPLWGFTTTRTISCQGEQPRTVLVALLLGSDLKAQVQWYPNFAQDSQAVARQLVQMVRQEAFLPQEVLLVADGINGSLMPLCKEFADVKVQVSGCMAAGDPSQGKTYGIGKNQAGPGALSAAILGGRFRVGVGIAHGWQDLGVYFHATRTRDVWVQTLNNQPAAETYARFFGYTAREWAFPPLTDMARLYPLGVEPLPESYVVARDTGNLRSKTGNLSAPGVPLPEPVKDIHLSDLTLRSALRIEVDGSLRMSAPVPEGAVVHLMSGDPNACLTAARDASQAALAQLGKAKPMLAIALVDAAWHLLFEATSHSFAGALKSVLGDIPLVGAYTHGQLVRPDLEKEPVLYNQNLALLVIGEAHE